ncbi:MAG: hypothetical protein AAF960_29880 [Bacteroidota bacterium]
MTSVKNYFGETEQRPFVQLVETTYGTPFWQGAKLLPKEEDGRQIGLIPILKEDSPQVSSIMFVNLDKGGKSPIFNFVDRANIEQYKEEKSKELSYGAVVLAFLNLDKRVFGNMDTNLVHRYRVLESSLRNEESDKATARNDVICYAVLYEVTTSWYAYNPMTGTLTYLSDTHSYQWEDLCINQGIDVPLPSNPSGGSGGSGGSGSSGGPNDTSPPSFTICEVKLHPFQNAYYINVNNLRIDFLHRSTGNIVRQSVNVCIQIPRVLGIPGSKRFIKEKFKIAVAGTENQLSALYPHSPSVSSSTIDILLRQQLKGQIEGRFGSKASVSTNCPGIPSYSPTWGC